MVVLEPKPKKDWSSIIRTRFLVLFPFMCGTTNENFEKTKEIEKKLEMRLIKG